MCSISDNYGLIYWLSVFWQIILLVNHGYHQQLTKLATYQHQTVQNTKKLIYKHVQESYYLKSFLKMLIIKRIYCLAA